jgi:hypothetical protein
LSGKDKHPEKGKKRGKNNNAAIHGFFKRQTSKNKIP